MLEVLLNQLKSKNSFSVFLFEKENWLDKVSEVWNNVW